jgi:hypothetical protein
MMHMSELSRPELPAFNELIEGVQMNRRWIRRIGITGICAFVFLWIAPYLSILGALIIFVIAYLSSVSGSKVRRFVAEWDSRYADLGKATGDKLSPMASIAYELVEGTQRRRGLIKTIGYIGGIFGATAFCYAFFLISVDTLFYSQVPSPVIGFVSSLFVWLSFVFGAGGAAILFFMNNWDKRYAALKEAQKELAKTYLPHLAYLTCRWCGKETVVGSTFCMNCGRSQV